MKIDIKIPQSVNQISKGIIKAVLPDIEKDFKNKIKQIKRELPYLINSIVTSAPEYRELTQGNLRLELGILDPEAKVEGLIDAWSKSIQYKHTPVKLTGNKISASFSASMIKADFEDVLGSDYAYVTDNLRGYSLPWLEWLMLYGTLPIVSGYDIVFGINKRSRTGGAVMRAGAGSWSVPSEVAGTISDNWITRSIANSSSQINQLLERTLG